MRYNFSSQFMRVCAPDTSFGQAWESLCHSLLMALHKDPKIQRLRSPDRGIDIWHQSVHAAYQCKSDERGAFGSLSATDSLRSLETALSSREDFRWRRYIFATNANYTGQAVQSVLSTASGQGIPEGVIEFLGPEYWDGLCQRYTEVVSDRFDFRVTVSENEVREAFRKARYYDKYIREYLHLIENEKMVIKVKNNRTPLELEVPFSKELTVENCVDVIQQLLGVSLDWRNFADTGTSAGPSISLTIDRRPLPFSMKVGEAISSSGMELEFWIKLIWKDETEKDAVDGTQHLTYQMFTDLYRKKSRGQLDGPARGKLTIERLEGMIQRDIWSRMEERNRETA